MEAAKNKEANVVYVSLGLAILLSIALMTSSLYALVGLQQITHNLYQHPFTVNNAALNLKINVLNIRKSMLQIAVGSGEFERSKKIMEEAEAMSHENLRLIRAFFLGDMSKVEQIEILLDQWQQKRTEELNVVRKGRRTSLMKTIEYDDREYTEKITALIDYVEDFSGKRAENFLRKV